MAILNSASVVAGTLSGLVGSETLLASVVAAHFSDSHAATAKTVRWDYALADGSGLASNYREPLSDSTTADILARTLTVTLGNTGVSKMYDGSSTSDITPAYQFSGLIAGDTGAALSHGTAHYNSAHVASANSVTVEGLSIDAMSGQQGSLASDYLLSSNAARVDARITPRPVTVSADAQYKEFGLGDPTLSYQMEAASAQRGLLQGEQLAGSLHRAPGEAAGSYAIDQGSVVDGNNPDYAIAFLGADLQIAAEKAAVPETPRMPEPARTYPGSIRLTDGDPSPFSRDALPTYAEVQVTLVRDAVPEQDGLVHVRVPRAVIEAGGGFRFPLPATLIEQGVDDASIQITTLNGQPLPSWLRYQPGSHSFVAAALPLGALPMQLLVRIGQRQWIVVVEELKNLKTNLARPGHSATGKPSEREETK